MIQLGLSVVAIALSLVTYTSSAHAIDEKPFTDLNVTAKIPYLEEPSWGPDRFLAFGYGALWFVVPPHLMVLDPKSNKITRIKLDEAMSPGFVTTGEGAVWVIDISAELLFKIDPKTRTVVERIPVATGLQRDSMIGLGAGSIWIVTGGSGKTLTRYAASSGDVISKIKLPASSVPGAFFAFDKVWVVSDEANKLFRIDPDTNTVVGETPLHSEPFAAAVDDTSIWVNNRNPSIVDRIDGATGKHLSSIEVGIMGYENLVTGAGSVWMSFEGSPLVKIDPSTNSVKLQYRKIGFTAISYGDGSLWLDDTEAILRVEPPK